VAQRGWTAPQCGFLASPNIAYPLASKYNFNMKTDQHDTMSADAIWQRVVEFEGALSSSVARALLRLHFSERDQELMEALAAKARAGSLSRQEQIDLDTFERLGCLLDVIHSNARQALKDKPKRAS
jgi:hypothetical protein